MDSKLLLVESILLLYRESQLPDQSDRSEALVSEIEANIALPEATMETSTGRDTIISLRSTLSFMLEQPPTYKFNRENLLQRLRVNVGNETYLYDIIKDGTEDLDDDEQIVEACRVYRNSLYGFLSKEKIKNIIKEASGQLVFREGNVDWSSYVPTLIEQLEPYANSMLGLDDSEKVDELDLGDINAMQNAIAEGQKEASTEGIMKTGWQGVNEMTGDHGGFRRGDCILIGALQHNFKSGFLMNIPKQIALYNTPHMLDVKKKPLILYISLENNLTDNILQLYASMRGEETGKAIDTRLVKDTEAAAYIKDRLSVNGYHFKMLRFNGNDFTYRKLFDLMDGYIQDGYELHLVSLDYMLMMSLEGCIGTNEAFMKRDLLRRIRNYTNPKKITFITAAQLSTEAKQLVRNEVTEFVKEVANKGYYDGCKALDNEADLEITIHIEKPGDGYSYLTMMRGKHRRPPPMTPEKDKYVVYRFEPYGLPEDINDKSLCRRSVGGGTAADGGGAAWWSSEGS